MRNRQLISDNILWKDANGDELYQTKYKCQTGNAKKQALEF
jgi:hypothetical protein